MTVVISFANQNMSIIMSDDRINYGNQQEFGYSDGDTKLIDLPNMGWVSGAGLSDFLNEFKQILAASEPSDTKELNKLYKKAVENSKVLKPVYSDFIQKSVAVASWVSRDLDFEEMFFRVGVFSEKHFGLEVAILEPGNILITYPGDYLDDLDKVKVIESNHKLEINDDTDFYEILRIMFEVFKEISSDSIYCSTNCDVGIQALQADGIYKMKISGEISFLLESLKLNELNESTEIVNINKWKLE